MSMGKWHPLSNLRSYLEHHPPAVIFFLCMLVLSLTFIGIGFYTQTHRVRNPDLTPDWNEFLESIASLHYCQSVNGSVDGELAPVPKGKGSGDPVDVEQRLVMVPLMFQGSAGGETPSILSTRLLGKQVGLKGAAEREVLNISLILYPHSQTTDPKQDGPGPFTCLQLRAPAAMLPKSPSPPDCPVQQGVAIDHFNTKVFPTDMESKNVPSAFRCLKLAFSPDERLTAFLSEEDKILVGQHLLFVSAALLVICGVLCIGASLPCSRSRRYHGNDLGVHKDM
ncbi:insulin-like growth factor-binding protein 3 receptor isoform X2 [Sardina pilchardus]|uniref:insulin-like growth factor-binding protein 3 receptor isoform X2 n=1 Tax=Sardina pilchardus TaxID=27697 RepID=UPI002E128154